jgi:hypothetical protein
MAYLCRKDEKQMIETNAGGQNTQNHRPSGVMSLEYQLERAAAEIDKVFTDARAVDPERDEFGHARSRLYTEAVAIMKASAKVGHTIAEMQGTKFEHNINVRREDAVPSRKSAPAIESDTGEPGDAEFEQYQGCDYDPSYRFADGTYFVYGRGRLRIPDGWDEKRWRAGLPQIGERGDPLPISGGSNGNFQESNAAAAQSGGP